MVLIIIIIIIIIIIRWFKYDRDSLCVNKSQFVPVIFEPPCIIKVLLLLPRQMMNDWLNFLKGEGRGGKADRVKGQHSLPFRTNGLLDQVSALIIEADRSKEINSKRNVRKRIIEARSHNHCCSRKAINITYSVCVCSLSYPACKVHAPCYIVICGPCDSTLSHNRHDFLGGGWKLLNIKCAFWFSTTFIWSICHFEKNSARYRKWDNVFIESTRYSCQILKRIEFSRQIKKKTLNVKCHENASSGRRVVPCGRTDERTWHDEGRVCHFSQFCERAKKKKYNRNIPVIRQWPIDTEAYSPREL
jgi:hypothetical protein